MSNLQGTTVPSNAFVEKVYINVDLSIEEVVSIIDSANLIYNFSSKYTVVDGIEISNMLGKTIIVNNEVIFREADSMNTGVFVGWKEDFNGIVVVNKQNSYGTQNDALSSLFSITPLTQAQEGQVIVSKSKLTAIADNIRNQTGATGLITLDEMAKMKLGGGATITTKGGWQGTPVPNSGYVEKVYFNTELSVDEVVGLLTDYIGSFLLINETSDHFIVISKDNFINPDVESFSILDGETILFTDYEGDGLDFTGWNPSILNGLKINSNVLSTFSPDGEINIPVGTQNEELSSLFSITPFVQATGEEVLLEGEYDGSTVEIDELPKGGWQGTPVPNSGYVEKVYFNTELSVDEVVAILETAKNNSGTDTVITYGSNELTIIKIVDSTLTPSYCWYIGNFSTFEIYFSSADNHEYANFAGWNASFGNVLEINSEVGQGSVDNSLLSALFSTTPFVQSESNTIDLKPYIDKKQIPLKFNLTNLPTGVDTSDATATSEDILLGKTAYVNDVKVVGSVPTYKGAVSGVQALVGNTLKRLLDSTKSCAYMFQNNTTITDVDDYFEYDDTMNVTNAQYMFSGCTKLQKSPRINMSNVANVSYIFKGCTSLSDIEDLDISNATNVSYSFDGCTNLIIVNDLNVSNATNVSNMFNNCPNLKQVNIVILNATTTLYMFNNCNGLEKVSPLNTSKSTNIAYMFYNNYNLEKIDISYYNISSTSNSNSTFYGCYSLKELIIRGFGSTSLNSNAFDYCYHLKGTKNETYNPNGDTDCYIYIPRNSVSTIKSVTNWSAYANQIMPIFDVQTFGDGNVEEIVNDNNETILTATANENSRFVGWYKCLLITSEKTVNIEETVYETLEITYPFTLNDNGYYQNTNQKQGNSYSIGRFNFNIENENQKLKITYLQTSEQNYDYGVIGKIDVALGKDTTDTGYTNFKGQTVTTNKELLISDIAIGEHFIDIKYKKDSSGDTGTDTLQVKVEVVTTQIVVEMINEELYSTENQINLGIIDEQTMQPLNLAGVFEGVEA